MLYSLPKKQQPEKRKLKVYKKYIQRAYHSYIVFPEIRLCGKWLHDMGFTCGKVVTVTYRKNKLIITVESEIKTNE